jgi:hypothetical protein
MNSRCKLCHYLIATRSIIKRYTCAQRRVYVYDDISSNNIRDVTGSQARNMTLSAFCKVIDEQCWLCPHAFAQLQR